jgi:hypothetical protein
LRWCCRRGSAYQAFAENVRPAAADGLPAVSFNIDGDESIWIMRRWAVLTARALLPELRQRYPACIFLSTTLSGQQVARAAPDGRRFPAVRSASFRESDAPRVSAVVHRMETEIWLVRVPAWASRRCS